MKHPACQIHRGYDGIVHHMHYLMVHKAEFFVYVLILAIWITISIRYLQSFDFCLCLNKQQYIGFFHAVEREK